jgi:hypothetical protein
MWFVTFFARFIEVLIAQKIIANLSGAVLNETTPSVENVRKIKQIKLFFCGG